MQKTNKSIIKVLGKAIQAQRKALGLSQTMVAELAGVGINFVSQVEAGKDSAHLAKVLDVMAVLGMQFRLEFGQKKIYIPEDNKQDEKSRE